MPSKTKSSAPSGSGTRIPSKWQRELQAQEKLRKRIKAVEHKHAELTKDRLRVLKAGGKGWVTALAKVNVRIDQEWERLRALLLKLYSRPNVV